MCSQSSDAAPRATASAAWRWPSVCSPGTQQKRAPAATRRLSKSTARHRGRRRVAPDVTDGDPVEEFGDHHHVEWPGDVRVGGGVGGPWPGPPRGLP